MKSTLSILLLAGISLFSSTVLAAGPACQTTDAKVKSFNTMPDGTSFVELDKAGNCACTVTTRYSFSATDINAKNFMTQALTAIAGKNNVTVMGAVGCVTESSTPAVYTIVIKNNSM